LSGTLEVDLSLFQFFIEFFQRRHVRADADPICIPRNSADTRRDRQSPPRRAEASAPSSAARRRRDAVAAASLAVAADVPVVVVNGRVHDGLERNGAPETGDGKAGLHPQADDDDLREDVQG